MKQHLLVDLADLLVRAEDVLDRATSGSPDYLLNRSNDADIWDVLGGLEEVLEEDGRQIEVGMTFQGVYV